MEAKVYRFVNKLPLPKIKPFLNYMHSKGKTFHLDQSIQAVIEWGQKFFLRALPLEGIRNIYPFSKSRWWNAFLHEFKIWARIPFIHSNG